MYSGFEEYVKETNLSGRFGIKNTIFSHTFAGDATDTDVLCVNSISGKIIRCLGITIRVATTSGNVTFNTQNGSNAGVAISQDFQILINTSMILPSIVTGWFETLAGEKLTITTTAGVTKVYVVYVEV